MTENNKAQIKPAKTVSAIWLIPIVAVIIGSWMVYYNWKNQGPVINIEFKTASGIEVGTTKIKSLDVDIGQVTQIRIKPNLDGVVVTARLSAPAYVNLLREDTHFGLYHHKLLEPESPVYTPCCQGLILSYIQVKVIQSNFILKAWNHHP